MKKNIHTAALFAASTLLAMIFLAEISGSSQAKVLQTKAGANDREIKKCIEEKLPPRTTVTQINPNDLNVTIKYGGVTVDATTLDQIKKAICSCKARKYSVTAEDQPWPGGRPIILITAECDSGDLPINLSRELSAVLSPGDVVRAKIENKVVTLTGTVTKQETIQAASNAARKAGAVKVINNLKVKKLPQPKK